MSLLVFKKDNTREKKIKLLSTVTYSLTSQLMSSSARTSELDLSQESPMLMRLKMEDRATFQGLKTRTLRATKKARTITTSLLTLNLKTRERLSRLSTERLLKRSEERWHLLRRRLRLRRSSERH